MIMQKIMGFRGNSKGLPAALVIVLIAWTSSISLGDNAPVFTIGLLAVTGLMITFEASVTWHLLQRNGWVRSLLPVLALIIWIGSLPVQWQNNYRDLGARFLTHDLGDCYPGLQGIRTQEETYRYMEEIREIFDAFNRPVGRFAIWPDNAILYPLLGSPNPFPVDWMQQAEFVGSEEQLLNRTDSLLDQPGIIILLEKYSIKELYHERVAMDYQVPAYPYIPLLLAKTVELPDDWEFFSVFITK